MSRSSEETGLWSKSWCSSNLENDSYRENDTGILGESMHAVQITENCSKSNKSQRITLLVLALTHLISYCPMSIMAPFFPGEASEKGMSEALSGFVFSFYALVMVFISPVYGKILPAVGVKFMFISGLFVTGCCNLIFGTLEYIDDYTLFTSFCFLIRGLEALGTSAFATACVVYVINTFPNNIGTVFGILETFVGLGMSIGPAIGGWLYSIGGFGLPFFLLGAAVIACIPSMFCLSPLHEKATISLKNGSILSLLKVPSAIITSLIIIVGSNAVAFLNPTLEPHLNQFELEPEQVGLIFLLMSVLYGISNPICGWIADRMVKQWHMMVWGLILSTIGLLIIGPSPLLPFIPNTLWIKLLGLSILSIGVSMSLLPTFQELLNNSLEGGASVDSITTYSIVGGVWSCMYYIGEVTGPSLGGVLLKSYGFPVCSTVMAAFTFLLSIFATIFYLIREMANPNSLEENIPLNWSSINLRAAHSHIVSGTCSEETQPLIIKQKHT